MDPGAPQLPLTRETTIRRDAEGRWFQDDVLIANVNVARAFDRWLKLAADGRFCLRNEINWAYVAIEGAPLFVRSLRVSPRGLEAKLSDDRDEQVDLRSLRIGPDGAMYCTARGATMAARFDRFAVAQLDSIVGEDAKGIYIEAAGAKVYPPHVDDPLRLPVV